MKLIRNFFIAAVLLASVGVYAKETPSKAFKLQNTIKSVEINEIETPPYYLGEKSNNNNQNYNQNNNPNKNKNKNNNQNNNNQNNNQNNNNGGNNNNDYNGDYNNSYNNNYNQDPNVAPQQQGPADVPVSMNDELQEVNNGVGQVVEIVDKLIAVGERLWKIVESGRAVVNAEGVVPSISVLPRGLETTGSLYDMFGWSEPVMKSYNVVYKNGYGVSVVKFDFTVMMQYGGTDGNGGVYISGLSIVPDSIEAAWGWDFNAQSRLINITNRGTQLAPVAAATIELGYQVKNALTNDSKRVRFFADANGKITKLK